MGYTGPNFSVSMFKDEGHMRKTLIVLCSFFLMLLANMSYALPEAELEQELSDSVITTKIIAKYTKNKQVNPFKIHVATVDGRVRLVGFVKDHIAFSEALRLAKNTRGVKTIDARELKIKQVNLAFTDAYITTKVEAAVLKAKLLEDESIPLVGINASTQNGIVTLTGAVKHSKSVVAILKYVARVGGVKKVISELTVAS